MFIKADGIVDKGCFRENDKKLFQILLNFVQKDGVTLVILAADIIIRKRLKIGVPFLMWLYYYSCTNSLSKSNLKNIVYFI